MNIDANNLVLGRMAGFAAKKLILGESVNIVNCDFAIITGKKAHVLKNYDQKVKRGHPLTGPYFPKQPHMIVKRTIRGMLPYKTARGREMLKRLKCFNGLPGEFKDKKMETVKAAQMQTDKTPCVKLGYISKLVGGKF